MPIVIEGKRMDMPPKSFDEFVDRYPHFKESAEKLLAQKCRTIVPMGLLYVGQREMAATVPEDEQIQMIGTDDATTCHMVVLRHSGSGAACVAHMDGCGTENAARKMHSLVNDLSKGNPPGRFELHLYGGFRDPNRTSEELSVKVLTAFNNLPVEIHLQTACISDLNTVKKNGKNFPGICGVVVYLSSGLIERANFPEHGPDLPLRGARHFTGSEEVIDIYDCKRRLLSIGPFNYSTMDEIDLLCGLPDQFIREHLSTSPEQEPPHFEAAVRAALKQIRDHPEPLKTVFKEGKPHLFRLESNGSWSKVEEGFTHNFVP